MRKSAATTLVLVVLAVGLVWAVGEMLNVQVRAGKMRSRPSFLGKVVAELDYGTEVTVQKRQGPWVKITTPDGKSGWLHESALGEKAVAMSSGSGNVDTGASEDELALAGKGFTEEVEEEFKKQHSELDFTWVDRMESITVTPEQAEAFLAEGQVNQEGGR